MYRQYTTLLLILAAIAYVSCSVRCRRDDDCYRTAISKTLYRASYEGRVKWARDGCKCIDGVCRTDAFICPQKDCASEPVPRHLQRVMQWNVRDCIPCGNICRQNKLLYGY